MPYAKRLKVGVSESNLVHPLLEIWVVFLVVFKLLPVDCCLLLGRLGLRRVQLWKAIVVQLVLCFTQVVGARIRFLQRTQKARNFQL